MIDLIVIMIGILVGTLKFRIGIVMLEKLQNQWRKYFMGKNVLIFGHKQAGKTALVTYLQTGKPYQMVDGKIVPPNPTLMTAVVDGTFQLQKGNWLKINADYPGDKQLRDTWRQAVSDIRPKGIIYMLDGRLDQEGIRREISEIFEFVLNAFEGGGVPDPRALHIFVNFADEWAGTPKEEKELLRFVEDEFGERLDSYRRMADFKFAVSATQLSPQKTYWAETNRALHIFGADLIR